MAWVFLMLWTAVGWGCDACTDRDTFKDSFVSTTNSQAAAATAAEPQTPAPAQNLPSAPRQVLSGAPPATASELPQRKKPYLRSFGELR